MVVGNEYCKRTEIELESLSQLSVAKIKFLKFELFHIPKLNPRPPAYQVCMLSITPNCFLRVKGDKVCIQQV